MSIQKIKGIALVCLFLEVGLRLIGGYTSSGEFKIQSLYTKPYSVPIEATSRLLNEYDKNPTSRIMYDAELGWTARPGSHSKDGLYEYNKYGARCESSSCIDSPDMPTLRIALLGDSCTHGDEVPFSQSWGSLLEDSLRESGINATVQNFGMSGYGMDQALLRYEKEVRALPQNLAPNLVIFGLQEENFKRNLNLFRPFYTHGAGDIPFFKPRYLLQHNDLILINSPTPRPDTIENIIGNFESWPLAQHEKFYVGRDYRRYAWRKSKLLAVLESLLLESNKYAFAQREVELYDESGEGVELAGAILRALTREVSHDGAKLMVVRIPFAYSLQLLEKDKVSLPYFAGDKICKFLKDGIQPVNCIDTGRALLNNSRGSVTQFYVPPYHFHLNEAGGKVVVSQIIEGIQQLTNGSDA